MDRGHLLAWRPPDPFLTLTWHLCELFDRLFSHRKARQRPDSARVWSSARLSIQQACGWLQFKRADRAATFESDRRPLSCRGKSRRTVTFASLSPFRQVRGNYCRWTTAQKKAALVILRAATGGFLVGRRADPFSPPELANSRSIPPRHFSLFSPRTGLLWHGDVEGRRVVGGHLRVRAIFALTIGSLFTRRGDKGETPERPSSCRG